MNPFTRGFTNVNNAFRSSVNVLNPSNGDVAKQAKLDWQIKAGPSLYRVGDKVREFPDHQTLYRSDDGNALSVVGKNFKVVQPAQMLELFNDLSERFGFKLEYAGATQGGRRIWGMAKTPYELEAIKGDKVAGFLLFATACDGGMATKAFFPKMRLWCMNQIPGLIARAKGEGVVSITHAEKYEHVKVTKGLELIQSDWDDFDKGVKKLTKKKVTTKQAVEFFTRLTYPNGEVPEDALTSKVNRVHRLIETYETGVGQEGIKGTAWGVLNAVTRFIDHESRAKNSDTRLYRAWFGGGARIKQEAYRQLLTFSEKA